MSSSELIQNISVIVACRSSKRHLLDVLVDLKLWFSEIIIVGPNCPEISKIVKTHDQKWVETELCSIQGLWKKGMQSVNSEWYLLLEGSEYISTVLKESILEVSNRNLSGPNWFHIKREIVFLKQRLKYPLEWTYDPKPGLLFKGTENLNHMDLDKIEKEPLKGRSIYFSEKTIEEAIKNSFHRADQAAVEISQVINNKGILKLLLKAIIHVPTNFFKKWVLQKGMREGFEGLVFSLLDTVTVILGYIRYYENILGVENK